MRVTQPVTRWCDPNLKKSSREPAEEVKRREVVASFHPMGATELYQRILSNKSIYGRIRIVANSNTINQYSGIERSVRRRDASARAVGTRLLPAS